LGRKAAVIASRIGQGVVAGRPLPAPLLAAGWAVTIVITVLSLAYLVWQVVS
jgi:hypothetical protein